MKETLFMGYPEEYCPHWTIDGKKCANCGEEVPLALRVGRMKVEPISEDLKNAFDDCEPTRSIDSSFIHAGTLKEKDIIGFDKDGFIKLPNLDKPNVTLDLDSDSIDKYTPLTIRLNGESITLSHEDIKDLFYREKERKITKLVDFMRDNGFKEKDINGVISNLRSES